ncbi:MAG TPA: hypothetical protein VMJ30_03850 [Gemmatimonadales bacterium]|nr:hypothetical protein [Gemmatimonadales bacterium]
MEALNPLFHMLGGIITSGLLFWALVRISQGEIGSAVARWISSHNGPATSSQLEREVVLLRGQVDQLERQLADVHERIDFAERMLTRGGAGVGGGAA